MVALGREFFIIHSPAKSGDKVKYILPLKLPRTGRQMSYIFAFESCPRTHNRQQYNQTHNKEVNYILQRNDWNLIRANEILSFTFRLSQKQIRSSSNTEVSIRVRFIPTHQTVIRRMRSPILSLLFRMAELGEKTIRFSLVTVGKQTCLHAQTRVSLRDHRKLPRISFLQNESPKMSAELQILFPVKFFSSS